MRIVALDAQNKKNHSPSARDIKAKRGSQDFEDQ